MAKIEFLFPDVGEGLEEGEIVSWLVAPGDTVTRDQPLVEVQTDKALVELPSPVGGQIVSLSFAPGDIVKVGQVLVVLEEGQGGDTAPTSPPSSVGQESAAVPSSPAASVPASPPAAEAASIGAAPPPSATVPTGAVPARGRPKAAPVVRKLALELGVDLASVTGTGPGGRILAADVEAAAAPAAPAPATGVPVIPSRGMRAVGDAGSAERPSRRIGWFEPGRHPLRGIRRVTAEAMARSWSEIPHLTTLDEIDATGLLAARRRLADAGIDATIGALLVAAVARGLRRYPVFNASLELPGALPAGASPPGLNLPGSPAGASPADASPAGGTIVVHDDCNIGLAVATADGLVVPVIRRADRRSLADLAAEVRRLTTAARNRRVEVAELRGGTFTISNWGAIGGRYATPLIRPPEVGIMGFGAIEQRPFVVDGEVKARPTLPWSLSADHRLIDGDVSTAFSEYVTGLLADPIALLAELLAGGTSGTPAGS